MGHFSRFGAHLPPGHFSRLDPKAPHFSRKDPPVLPFRETRRTHKVQMAAAYIPAKGKSDDEDGSDGGSSGGDEVDEGDGGIEDGGDAGGDGGGGGGAAVPACAFTSLNVRGDDSVASDVSQHGAICAARRRATTGQVSQTRVCQTLPVA